MRRCGSLATACAPRLGPRIAALALLVALALSCTWPRTARAQSAAAAAQEARQSAAAARRDRERARSVRLAKPPAPQPIPAAYAPYPYPPWYAAPRVPASLPVEPRDEPGGGQGLMIAGGITLAFAAAPLFTVVAILTEDTPGDGDGGGNLRSTIASMFAVPGVAAAICGAALLGAGAGRDNRAGRARASATPGPSASIRVGPGVAFVTGAF